MRYWYLGVNIPASIRHNKSEAPWVPQLVAFATYCSTYRKVSNISRTKSQNLNASVWSCSCLYPIRWSRVLSWEWRCSWSSTDRRCSNYIWVINNLIAYLSAPYIRDLTVCSKITWFIHNEKWIQVQVQVKVLLLVFCCYLWIGQKRHVHAMRYNFKIYLYWHFVQPGRFFF